MGRRKVECKWARSQGESNHNIGNFQSRKIPGGKVLGGFILGYCIVRKYFITQLIRIEDQASCENSLRLKFSH